MSIPNLNLTRLALLNLLVGVTLTACGTGDSQPAKSAEDQGGAHSAVQSTVEVAREGSRFDPAVPVSKIPDGAWMCVMGTVHYAALDQGDGKCPVCGMRLEQRALPGAESEDGHDHDHH